MQSLAWFTPLIPCNMSVIRVRKKAWSEEHCVNPQPLGVKDKKAILFEEPLDPT